VDLFRGKRLHKYIMNFISYFFRTLILQEYFDTIIKQKMSDNITLVDDINDQCNESKDKQINE